MEHGAKAADRYFAVSLYAAAAVLVMFMFKARFCYDIELPYPPAAPIAQAESDSLPKAAQAFREMLSADARKYRLPDVHLDELAREFPYHSSTDRIFLIPGSEQSSIEVAGLRLSVSARDLKEARSQLLVLRVDNLYDRSVAYRVEGRPTRGDRSCRGHARLRFNAVALPAGGSSTRAICYHRSGHGVEIRLVEVMEIPSLSFYYVSSMRPAILGFDRVPAGHAAPMGVPVCDRAVSASLDRAMKEGEVSWRDLTDFYARHGCGNFRFPIRYRAHQGPNPISLPAVAPAPQ